MAALIAETGIHLGVNGWYDERSIDFCFGDVGVQRRRSNLKEGEKILE